MHQKVAGRCSWISYSESYKPLNKICMVLIYTKFIKFMPCNLMVHINWCLNTQVFPQIKFWLGIVHIAKIGKKCKVYSWLTDKGNPNHWIVSQPWNVSCCNQWWIRRHPGTLTFHFSWFGFVSQTKYLFLDEVVLNIHTPPPPIWYRVRNVNIGGEVGYQHQGYVQRCPGQKTVTLYVIHPTKTCSLELSVLK